MEYTEEEMREIDKQAELDELKTKYFFDAKNHLHSIGGKPLIGTSSVGSILSKPLTYWASGKAVETLGWSNPKLTEKEQREKLAKAALDIIKKYSVDEYLKALDTAYHAHAKNLKDTAKTGTDLHAELENFVKNGVETELIQPFVKWSKENVKQFIGSEVYCFSLEHWLGGITDCIAELKNGQIGIIDFKSSREAYPNQFFQCAGYGLQLKENGGFDKDGNKLLEPIKNIDFLAVVPFGSVEKQPVFQYNVSKNEEAFLSELNLYKILNNY